MGSGIHEIEVAPRSLDDYAEIAGVEAAERIRERAAPLAGTRVLHVGGAGSGARVPELLGSLLPLLAGLGLEPEWRVVYGSGDSFPAVARALHDGLQGAESAIRDTDWSAYLDACETAAAALPDEYDAVVLHDPQTLGLAEAVQSGAPRVWRCHVDASTPDPGAWERLRPLAERCDALAFAIDGFAPPDLDTEASRALPPALDPTGPKHVDLPVRLAGGILRSLGIDLGRPFCCQVARLDPWKDPHSVIDAFSLAKEELPELQLVIAGALAPSGTGGDPEGWRIANEISDYAAGQPDVHLLTNYLGVGGMELNAIRRLARVAVQRSIREGFGLAASEALWQGTPVVAAPEGGIPLQVRDGIDGHLVEGIDETAQRIVELVRDPGAAIEMGAAGRERVRERFLITRLVEDELALLADVLAARPSPGVPVRSTP